MGYIIVQKPVSRNMEDIQFSAIACFIRAFHEKMINDIIDLIRNNPVLHYKKRSKAIRDFNDCDPLAKGCRSISAICTKTMSSYKFCLCDEDISKLWLVLDYILVNKMSKFSFIGSTGMFSCILDEMSSTTDAFKEVEEHLFTVSQDVSEQKFNARMNKAKASAEKKGIECIYDKFVFDSYERSELKMGAETALFFIKVFSSRENFEAISFKHRKKIGEAEYKELNDLMKSA